MPPARRPTLSFARWLGPWSSMTRRPAGIRDEIVQVEGDRPLEVRLYRPRRRPTGAYVLCTGLHPAGAHEPRLDRFARIMAAAGNLVALPHFDAYARMWLDNSVVDDTIATLDLLLEQPDLPPVRPGIFGLSFGSAPALISACRPSHRDRVGSVITFGGVSDFVKLLDEVTGDMANDIPPENPIILPAALINLAEELADSEGDAALLSEAWRSMCLKLWGKSIPVLEKHWEPTARSTARRLPARLRDLFDAGVGLNNSYLAQCDTAMDAIAPRLRTMDPRPHLPNMSARVRFIHGKDDVVVNYHHTLALEEASSGTNDHRAVLTGLYAHSGNGDVPITLRGMGQEARALLSVLSSLAQGALTP